MSKEVNFTIARMKKGSKMILRHSLNRPALAAYLQQLVAVPLKIKGFQLSKR